MWVERNDGSSVFRGDASFFRRVGLADATAVSFESSNFTGRYIRQSQSLLYVQVVGDATARSDATFFLE